MATAYLLGACSEAMRAFVAGVLESGWQIESVQSVEELGARFAGEARGLVLMEGGSSGPTQIWAARVRAPGAAMAIVLEMADDSQVVELLQAGADQILQPGRSPAVARAQLAALARRSSAAFLPSVECADQALVGSLSRGLAHELNNPVSFLLANLRALRGYRADLLTAIGEPMPAAVREVLDDLGPLVEESLEGAVRVQRLAQALREFARVEDGEPEPIDVHEALEVALRLTGAEIKHRVRIDRRFEAQTRALGWPARVRQLFAHLIVSGVRALPKSEEEQPLVLATSSNGSHLRVVLEAPRGFDLEVVTRIWEPFFANRIANEEPSLWLTAAARLARLHGGTLSLLPGRGLQVELRADLEDEGRRKALTRRLPGGSRRPLPDGSGERFASPEPGRGRVLEHAAVPGARPRRGEFRRQKAE
ncbi:MAG: HAMP domain-containing histidine kinase [Deltaproteobacteria bacterium]|nr:HAMP domain-containing histidine kinase [Deltaproteobacteria bacterium]